MTPTQFRKALERLGLSQVAAARFLGIGDRTSRRWASGDVEVPRAVAILLRLMISHSISPAEVE